MKQYFLGIDGGGSKTHLKLTDQGGKVLWEDIQQGQKANYDLEKCISQTNAILTRADKLLPQNAQLNVGVGWAGMLGESIHEGYIKGVTSTLPGNTKINLTAKPDATTACYAAHGLRDGGIVIAGTGSVGWAHTGGKTLRWGGWSIEDGGAGSGYWLGKKAITAALQAHDKRIAHSPFTQFILDKFGGDAVLLDQTCRNELNNPGFIADYAKLAVEFAKQDDAVALMLLKSAADEVGDLCAIGLKKGLPMALMGGLAAHIYPHLSAAIQKEVVLPTAKAVDGALVLARKIAGEKA